MFSGRQINPAHLLSVFNQAVQEIEKHNFLHGRDGPFRDFLQEQTVFLAMPMPVPEKFSAVVHRRAQNALVEKYGIPLARYGLEIGFQPIDQFSEGRNDKSDTAPSYNPNALEGSHAYIIAFSAQELMNTLKALKGRTIAGTEQLVMKLAEGIEVQLSHADMICSNPQILRELMVNRDGLGEVFYKFGVPELQLRKISSALGKFIT